MIMEDTWERAPIEGKFTGVPGEPHWGRWQPEVKIGRAHV